MQLTVPPLLPGVPTVDKLHAFALTQYRALAALDNDMLVLRDPHAALFGPAADSGQAGGHHDGAPSPLTMAHHPYDFAQA